LISEWNNFTDSVAKLLTEGDAVNE
ncbi:PadR family transcriptional regulator, partial [Listeria monocytogenes]|nr:PadR family transcriptional regulator [Listeria monocytogenes]HEM1735747.1 PadR family transcriptional regulator [Listeria monocytogenes]